MQTQTIDSLRLRFPHGGRMTVVHPAEITRLEAISNYTRVYLQDHPPVLMAKVLRAYDVMLRPYGFVRIHRSHLVNRQFVESVLFEGYIEMKDKSKIEISRRRKDMVMQQLKKTP